MKGRRIMVDLYKQYNDYFGGLVQQMVQEEKKWKRAELLNKIDMALMTRDREWFFQLRRELEGWK
jgi:uncharacterized protein YpiB (UPF0302 family)